MSTMEALRAAAVLMVAAAQLASAQNEKPNFVFVLADDQGWGDVGYNEFKYSHPAYQYDWTYNPPRTPNLDAMAKSDNSILFYRFYAGSGVCSPTRSAVLTGRTPGKKIKNIYYDYTICLHSADVHPVLTYIVFIQICLTAFFVFFASCACVDRECITGAEGCGSKPTWTCDNPLPLPEPTPTVAEAAKKANYSTIHIGKWHLGDFFFKDAKNPNFAYKKWPVSHPGMHGFDEWHSTEASAPSSTTNCGCNQEWWEASPGCITGGGEWEHKAYPCTNYWFPLDLDNQHKPTRPMCANESDGSVILQQDCVGNLTTKIPGDDSEYIMDVFEEYLTRKTGSEKQPFLAMLWLHTVHEPHPSLPQFYHNYTDAFGDPAGDYLGTITQMDVQIGRLRQMLKDKGVADNTMVWYTADNGPHAQQRDQNKYNALGATNGLRQCKASLYEGGIRTPGIIEWPAVISKHSATWHPAYVSARIATTVIHLFSERPMKKFFSNTHHACTWTLYCFSVRKMHIQDRDTVFQCHFCLSAQPNTVHHYQHILGLHIVDRSLTSSQRYWRSLDSLPSSPRGPRTACRFCRWSKHSPPHPMPTTRRCAPRSTHWCFSSADRSRSLTTTTRFCAIPSWGSATRRWGRRRTGGRFCST